MEALERHGAVRGGLLAAARLLRCHPFARSGYDPVPPNVDAQQVAQSDSARATRPGSLEVV